MINGLMYKDHEKYEFNLYLYDRHKNKIREIKDVLNRNYIAKMSGIHEFSFDIPYTIHSIIGGDIDIRINPNFYDVVPEMLLKVVIKPKNSNVHIKEDFYYIDSVTPSEDETGKKINQVTAYLLPYALKYKNLVFYEDVSSLEEVFNRTIGRKTLWTIGHIDDEVAMSGDYVKRRFIDADNVNLLDFFFDLIEIFNAVPIFDTIENKVNFYSYENSGDYTDLTISDEQYLKSIVVQPNYDNVITRMYCYGSDELNFRNINPTGVDYVEDFSYYMNIQPSYGGTLGQEQLGMSHELIDALKLYQADIDKVEGKFTGLLREQENAQRDLMSLQNGMDTLKTEYIMLQDQLDILNSANQDGHEVKEEMDRVKARIKEQERYIDDQEVDLGYIKQRVDTLKDEVDISNHLTDDLLLELNGFVKEHMWIDTTYVDEFDLYRDAKDKIKLLSQPLTTFEIDIVDLLKVGSAFSDWSKLRINNVIKLKHRDLGIDIEAKISEMEYGIDSNELSLVISNDRYMIDGIGELKDLIDTTTSTSTQIDLNKIKWDKAVKTSTDIDHIIDAKWDTIKDKIEVGANNSVEIGRRGIIIRDSENPDNYLVANNGVLAITDDGGATWKHAITAEGIVGERIYGKLGVFAKLRADQIIVGDNGERISDNVIGSADYWNEMANSIEDNLDAIESIGDTDIMIPKDKLILEREYYQLTSRYINMIKDLDADANPREYKSLIEQYEKIQKVSEPLLENMETTSKYDSRAFREIYKDYYAIEEMVTGIIAKDKNEQLNQMEQNVKNELEDFVENTVDPLKDYVDGNMTMWFYYGRPTLTNYPSMDWKEEDYENHVGDLYYDETWGNAYRFIKDHASGMYMWKEIGDNSIINAMYIANQAKDTADGKRRVFVDKPFTPYDEGDLWTQGVNGHLMVAKNSRRSGEFDLSDWERATKYTDDTKAIEAVQKAQDSLDKIYHITDDGTITKDEKIQLEREWDTIKNQYVENILVAEKYDIAHSTYKNAYKVLYDVVVPVLNDDEEYYNIDRAMFNAAFKDYYIQELGLQDRIYYKIEERANQYTDDKVGQFESDLADLESNLTGFLDDLVITLMESKSLERSMEQVSSSAVELLSAASDLGIASTNEYRDFYISIFGANGLKEKIKPYIGQDKYPIRIDEESVDGITKAFEEVGRTKERLSERIEVERDKKSQNIQKEYTEEKVKALEKELVVEIDKANDNLRKISSDNYITKMESDILSKDFESVSGQIMETIKLADAEGLMNTALRNQLYTETFGYEGLRGLLEPYIEQEEYPIELPKEHMDKIIAKGELVSLLQQKLLGEILEKKAEKIIDEGKRYVDKVMGDFDGSVADLEDTINSIANDLVITKIESEMLSKDLSEVSSGAFVILDVADNLGLYSDSSRREFYNSIFGQHGLKDVLEEYINQDNYPIEVTKVELGIISSAFVEVSQKKEMLQDVIEKTRANNTLEQSIYYTSEQVNKLDKEISSEIEAANNTIQSITNDLIITKMESEMLNKDLEGVLGTASELLMIADGLNLYENTKRQKFYSSVFGFDGLKSTLSLYIDQSSYPIKVTKEDLAEINMKFRDVAESKENLVDEINKAQISKIEDSYVQYINEVTKGLDDKIGLAQTTANNAKDIINSISSDNYITKMESESLSREFSSIKSAATEIISIADEMYLQNSQERKDYYNSIFGDNGLEGLLKYYLEQDNYPVYITHSDLQKINEQFKEISKNREALSSKIEQERDRLLSGEISGDLYEIEKKTDDIKKLAEDASTDASIAKNTIYRVSEDNYITKMESHLIGKDIDGIKTTALEIINVADSIHLKESQERQDYYNIVFGDSGIITTMNKYTDSYYYPIHISEEELEDITKLFEDVSKNREKLVDKIERERNRLLSGEISLEIYEIEQITKNIETKAENAQLAANSASSTIRRISEDNYITKMETESLSRDLENMKKTATEILSIADNLSLNYSSERIDYYNSMYGDNGLEPMLSKYINITSYPIYIYEEDLKAISKQFGVVAESREILVGRIETERNKLLSGSINSSMYEIERIIEGVKVTADRANSTINQIASDNYITKIEANSLKRDLSDIEATSTNILEVARRLGLRYTLEYRNYEESISGDDGVTKLLEKYIDQDVYPIYISDDDLDDISKHFANVSHTRESLVLAIEDSRNSILKNELNKEIEQILLDTEGITEKVEEAITKSDNVMNTVDMISKDDYITKTEGNLLKQNLSEVKETATEILKVADTLHLNTTSERVNYYNSIYGDDGLEKLLDRYIDSYYYPVHMSSTNVQDISNQLGNIAKHREQLVDKIEKERNRLLNGEISLELYELEKKTSDIDKKVDNAKNVADNAKDTIDMISKDNYITKTEGNSLKHNLSEVKETATEILRIADTLHLNTTSERVSYYNSIYGDDGLENLLDKYIDSYYYPVYIFEDDIEAIAKQFGEIAKNREKLVDKIEVERNRLLSGEISLELHEIEKKTENIGEVAQSARDKADGARSIINSIASDNYITQTESHSFNKELNEIKQTATEILRMADELQLNTSSERVGYWNAIYGEEGLENTLDRYIKSNYFPMYMQQSDVDKINEQFATISKAREQLVSKIEKERNRLLSGDISLELYKLEKKTEDISTKSENASSIASNVQSNLDRISNDNYITKMEAEMLAHDIEEITGAANEILDIADELQLNYSTERVNYYNSIYGKDKLKDTIDSYLNRGTYPAYVYTSDIINLKEHFKSVGETRELLVGKIEVERNRLLSGQISTEMYEIEKKAESASNTASAAYSTIRRISEDNYITKLESELLKQDLSDVVETANGLIELADSIGLRYYPERIDYYNNVFGDNGLKGQIDKYIDQNSYPMYISSNDLKELKDTFGEVASAREKLSNRIVNKKDSDVEYNLQQDIIEIEKITKDIEEKANRAQSTANGAYYTVNNIASDSYISLMESESLNKDLEEMKEAAREILKVADSMYLNTTSERVGYWNSIYGDSGVNELLKPYIDQDRYPIYMSESDLASINRQFATVASKREILIDKIEVERNRLLNGEISSTLYKIEKKTENIEELAEDAKSIASSAESTVDRISKDEYITKMEAEMLDKDLEEVRRATSEILKIADELSLEYSTERKNYYNSVYGSDGIIMALNDYVNKSYYPIYVGASNLRNIKSRFAIVTKYREELVGKIELERNRLLSGEIAEDIYAIEKKTENISKIAEDAKSIANSTESTLYKISRDEYITKMESEMLDKDLEEIRRAATEIIKIADDLSLEYSSERVSYYNAVYGSNGIVTSLSDYIGQSYYPIYIGTSELNSIKSKFALVTKYREELVGKIEKERDRILSGAITLEMYELEQKANSAKSTADRAENTINSIAGDNYITKIESESLNQRLSEATRTALELTDSADKIGLSNTEERKNYYNAVFGIYGISTILRPYINQSKYPIEITDEQLNDINNQFGSVSRHREKLVNLITNTKDDNIAFDISGDIAVLEDAIANISKDGAITEQDAKLLEAQYAGLLMEAENLSKQIKDIGYSNLVPDLKKEHWEGNQLADIEFENVKGTLFAYCTLNQTTSTPGIRMKEYKRLKKGKYRIWYSLKDNSNINNTLTPYIFFDESRNIKLTPRTVGTDGGRFSDTFELDRDRNIRVMILASSPNSASDTFTVSRIRISRYVEEEQLQDSTQNVKSTLNKVINASKYPITVGNDWADTLLSNTKMLLESIDIAKDYVDKMISDTLLHDVDDMVQEEVPKLIDMNPDLIKSSRKYSDVQITKEKGLMATHSHGEYTQLNGSGLVRYVPYPKFRYTPTNKYRIWRFGYPKKDTYFEWIEGYEYAEVSSRDTKNGEYFNEMHMIFYSTNDNNTVSFDFYREVHKRGRNYLQIELDGQKVFDESTEHPPESIKEDKVVTAKCGRGYHYIYIRASGNGGEGPAKYKINSIRYDSNVHTQKLVGWEDKGYRYGYRTHIGEATSDSRYALMPVKVQLPMDFVMDTASSGTGFDVYLAVKEYSGTYSTVIQPHLKLLDVDYNMGTFDVEAYVESTQSGNYGSTKQTPLSFTYFVVARK